MRWFDFSHFSTGGNGFGEDSDEIWRYQTFNLQQDVSLQTIWVKVRKVFGTSQSDLCATLVRTSDGMQVLPTPMTVPCGQISEGWTVIPLDFHLSPVNLPAGEYAVALSQVLQQTARYEWAVGPSRAGAHFGKTHNIFVGTNQYASGPDYPGVDETSSLGNGWVMVTAANGNGEIGQGEIVDVTHSGTAAYGFGHDSDEVKRYQTFALCFPRVLGVDLCVRKFSGSPYSPSDLTVELHATANGQPTGDALASATIPYSSVGSDWTTVHASLMCADLTPGVNPECESQEYAIVVGQRVQQDARYEWAVGDVSQVLHFGKGNGSSWIDESGFGSGWMKIWATDGYQSVDGTNAGVNGFGFGHNTDELKRFQIAPAPGALSGLDLKVRKIVGTTDQSDITVELCSTGSDGLPSGAPIAQTLIPSYSVSDQWTIVHAPVNTPLPPGDPSANLAVVLGQQTTQNERYEWIVGPGNLKFGKWNGSAWIVDLLGNGWYKLWLNGDDAVAVDLRNTTVQGNAFGDSTDQIKRFQTFSVPDPPSGFCYFNHCGVELKVRRAEGEGLTQSDLVVELYAAQGGLPGGDSPLTTAIVESGLVSYSDWTILQVPLACEALISGQNYAIVLGQRSPNPVKYEWAVGPATGPFNFGKWNGTSWVDESGLGNGYSRLWLYLKPFVQPN